jgi:hypothetical protein
LPGHSHLSARHLHLFSRVHVLLPAALQRAMLGPLAASLAPGALVSPAAAAAVRTPAVPSPVRLGAADGAADGAETAEAAPHSTEPEPVHAADEQAAVQQEQDEGEADSMDTSGGPVCGKRGRDAPASPVAEAAPADSESAPVSEEAVPMQ